MKVLSRLPAMETCVTSLVLAFLWHGVTAFLCDYAGDVTVQRDTYLQVPALTSLFGLGLSMCDRKCINVTGSVSYNYFRPDGKCECLGETSANSSQAVVSREGWHHGNITTSDKAFSTNCTSIDCHACTLDMPALIRCPIACPPPPPLNGSTVHVTAVSPPAAVSYTCLEDFAFFGSSSHVTCTAEGTWEGLNGTCQQTSWTNPTQSQFPIPQPVEANWRAETIFNFTTATNEIRLMDGSDIRALVSMRIKDDGRSYTALNSRYAGAWQTEVRVYNGPFGTGLVFNVTIVLNCPAFGFQVFVDGMVLGTYKHDYKPCNPFDALLITPGIDLYSLRMVYP